MVWLWPPPNLFKFLSSAVEERCRDGRRGEEEVDRGELGLVGRGDRGMELRPWFLDAIVDGLILF